MNFFDLILIPVLFGVIGFFEPCSMGANIIFLNKLNQLNRTQRISETILFSLVRGSFLAVVGLTAAFIGSKFITIQSNLFIILGVVYIILGILYLVNIYYPVLRVNFNLLKCFKGTVALGVAFGLIIPACAIPFVVALVGQALIMGNLLEGFISLFIFGVTLSIPLVLIAYSEKSSQIIQKISVNIKTIKCLPGIILIIVGILTILSSVWWQGALN